MLEIQRNKYNENNKNIHNIKQCKINETNKLLNETLKLISDYKKKIIKENKCF